MKKSSREPRAPHRHRRSKRTPRASKKQNHTYKRGGAGGAAPRYYGLRHLRSRPGKTARQAGETARQAGGTARQAGETGRTSKKPSRTPTNASEKPKKNRKRIPRAPQRNPQAKKKHISVVNTHSRQGIQPIARLLCRDVFGSSPTFRSAPTTRGASGASSDLRGGPATRGSDRPAGVGGRPQLLRSTCRAKHRGGGPTFQRIATCARTPHLIPDPKGGIP